MHLMVGDSLIRDRMDNKRLHFFLNVISDKKNGLVATFLAKNMNLTQIWARLLPQFNSTQKIERKNIEHPDNEHSKVCYTNLRCKVIVELKYTLISEKWSGNTGMKKKTVRCLNLKVQTTTKCWPVITAKGIASAVFFAFKSRNSTLH